MKMLVKSTAGGMRTFPSVYNLLINIIYLSHSAQIAGGSAYRKHGGKEREQKNIIFWYNIILNTVPEAGSSTYAALLSPVYTQ